MSVMDVCASRPYQHCETAIGKKENKINQKKTENKTKKETDIQKAGRKKTLHSLKRSFVFHFVGKENNSVKYLKP